MGEAQVRTLAQQTRIEVMLGNEHVFTTVKRLVARYEIDREIDYPNRHFQSDIIDSPALDSWSAKPVSSPSQTLDRPPGMHTSV